MIDRYCSVCGQPAIRDSRGGSVDHYLVCGCGEDVWVNDGRGGYMANSENAKPVTADEYMRLKQNKKD